MKPVRPAARILLLDRENRLLLFRFSYTRGPLAGCEYWGVPGGGVEEGESHAEAARRELREETGLRIVCLGPEVAETAYEFRLSTGAEVQARDYYFVVRIEEPVSLSRDGYTAEESENLVERRWWRLSELHSSRENIIPADLPSVLERAGVCGRQ